MFYSSIDLGGPNIAAGQQSKVLDGVLPGKVLGFWVRINFTLAAITSAFNASIPLGGAAEGVDDLDKIMAAFFSDLTYYLDETQDMFVGMAPAKLRTFLLFLNGLRDYESSISNGLSLVTSATGYTIRIYIPLSLRDHFIDGDTFAQGSERVRKGRMLFNIASTTPSAVVLNAGSANLVLSSIQVMPDYTEQGSASYVGPTWRLRDNPNVQANSPVLESVMRLALFETTTNYAGTWTVRRAGAELINIDRTKATDTYRRDNLVKVNSAQSDICLRVTPLLSVRRAIRFTELDPQPRAPAVTNNAGNVQNFREVHVIPTNNDVAEQVATRIGAGGPVTTMRPKPITTGGIAIPASHAGLVGITAVPGSVAIPGGKRHRDPASVADNTNTARPRDLRRVG